MSDWTMLQNPQGATQAPPPQPPLPPQGGQVQPPQPPRRKNGLLLVLGLVALLLMGMCVCGGLAVVPLAKRVAAGVQATLQATMQAGAASQFQTPAPLPAPRQTTPPENGGAVDLDLDTSYTQPAKNTPFRFVLAVANHSSGAVRVCAVNFRGDLAAILEHEAILSPAGRNYWVEGRAYQQGAVFQPCVVVGGGQTQQFVFSMMSRVAPATWRGEVGVCGQEIHPDDPPAVLDNCIYIPATVVVP